MYEGLISRTYTRDRIWTRRAKRVEATGQVQKLGFIWPTLYQGHFVYRFQGELSQKGCEPSAEESVIKTL